MPSRYFSSLPRIGHRKIECTADSDDEYLAFDVPELVHPTPPSETDLRIHWLGFLISEILSPFAHS
jgi:hypothetical protein